MFLLYLSSDYYEMDYNKMYNNTSIFVIVKLTKQEQESLRKLGNKEFLLSKEDITSAWLSLVDIVYAFCYNHRTTQGDNTVESAWTVNKLSATLSWLQVRSCFKTLNIS